jgi:anti-sigma factor RsiW
VASLRTAALERELARALSRQSWRARLTGAGMRRVAAGIVLFAAGWGANGLLDRGAAPYPGYVAEAIGAHQVFAYDTIRPVEFAPDSNEVALAWISDKLERKITGPTLDALGLTMVGSRLQGTREGPLAQFIYEDGDGNRLSLIVAPHPEGAPAASLKYASLGEERVGYWSDAELDYAVAAKASDAEIEAVMQLVSLAMAGKT